MEVVLCLLESIRGVVEIYEVKPNGRLVKKRDFHKWEQLVSWEPEYNVLASESINRMNGF